jgi:hypothetical protein
MESEQAQKIAIVAAIAAMLAVFATGRLPRWLRVSVVFSLAFLACAAGLFGYRYATHPVTLTVATGSVDGDVTRLMSVVAARMAAAEQPVRLKVVDKGTALDAVNALRPVTPDGVIAVEAKVDEPFDDVVSDWIERDARRNPRSPPYRQGVIERYAKALSVDPESLLGVRYQLLQRTLCASIVARAKGLSEAWMIVQHFPRGTANDKVTNRSDFDAFVALVGKAPAVEGVKVQLAWAVG